MSTPSGIPKGPVDGPVELAFTSLDQFVREYLSQVIHRRLNRSVQLWCPEWWRHSEAVARLSVMWRAFEYLRQVDPALGMSTWWLQHADPHLRALMHPQYGPFVACDPRDGHGDMQPGGLPAVPAPDILMAHPAFALQDEDLEAVVPQPLSAQRPERSTTDTDSTAGKAKTMDKDHGREHGG
ncbi:DUF4913 domain-containing protein [Yinghuangia sp. ASG 101]|uniref:DUF4913 domain-containing protein n=1 Tax=Yinghuangia sp. ASG 101 TaxID=2896848 RepID=UPI001E3083C9|nr:DUF4913 domain-containing protein [Yinghuangia sp. ASG 101]UGQ12303.1 DUF4913 domain-containing protein [Yinghuangia sp. ASG 101]